MVVYLSTLPCCVHFNVCWVMLCYVLLFILKAGFLAAHEWKIPTESDGDSPFSPSLNSRKPVHNFSFALFYVLFPWKCPFVMEMELGQNSLSPNCLLVQWLNCTSLEESLSWFLNDHISRLFGGALCLKYDLKLFSRLLLQTLCFPSLVAFLRKSSPYQRLLLCHQKPTCSITS